MSEAFTFGYARVSTDDQDADPQIKALMRHGIPRDQIYIDKASGSTMDRKELAKVIKILRPGDTLVVTRLDRLGRTLSGMIEAAEKMRQDDINLVSLSESIDTSSAVGKMFYHIIAAFAQFERDLISERTKIAMAAKKANGQRFGKRHYIVDYPKRLDWFETAYHAGEVEDMSATDIVAALNAADPKAPKIEATETYYKWRRQGWPGANLREPALDE